MSLRKKGARHSNPCPSRSSVPCMCRNSLVVALMQPDRSGARSADHGNGSDRWEDKCGGWSEHAAAAMRRKNRIGGSSCHTCASTASATASQELRCRKREQKQRK